jgi:hypothetical protein
VGRIGGQVDGLVRVGLPVGWAVVCFAREDAFLGARPIVLTPSAYRASVAII